MRIQGGVKRTLMQLLSDSEEVLLGWTACEKLHKTLAKHHSVGVQMSRLDSVSSRVRK